MAPCSFIWLERINNSGCSFISKSAAVCPPRPVEYFVLIQTWESVLQERYSLYFDVHPTRVSVCPSSKVSDAYSESTLLLYCHHFCNLTAHKTQWPDPDKEYVEYLLAAPDSLLN